MKTTLVTAIVVSAARVAAGVLVAVSTSGTALAKFNETPAGVSGGVGAGGADNGNGGKGAHVACSDSICTTSGGGGGTTSSGSGGGGGQGG